MTYYDIIQINEDGKIELPLDSAYDIGVRDGAYFLIEVSPEVKEARLERVALPGANLVEMELVVENKPGVLSKLSSKLANHNVNILFSESEDVEPEEAVLVIVVDVSEMDFSLSELEKEVCKLEELVDFNLKEIA